jgi:hypothetical protein
VVSSVKNQTNLCKMSICFCDLNRTTYLISSVTVSSPNPGLETAALGIRGPDWRSLHRETGHTLVAVPATMPPIDTSIDLGSSLLFRAPV